MHLKCVYFMKDKKSGALAERFLPYLRDTSPEVTDEEKEKRPMASLNFAISSFVLSCFVQLPRNSDMFLEPWFFSSSQNIS